jgi:hypothetical protein
MLKKHHIKKLAATEGFKVYFFKFKIRCFIDFTIKSILKYKNCGVVGSVEDHQCMSCGF